MKEELYSKQRKNYIRRAMRIIFLEAMGRMDRGP